MLDSTRAAPIVFDGMATNSECGPNAEPRRIIFQSLLIVLSLIIVFASASAQQNPPPKNRYEVLLEKLKNRDQSLDFKDLRLAYAETSAYNPYGSDKESQKAMFAAIKASQWNEVLKQSAAILDRNYLDINAHFGALLANRGKGVTDKAEFHRFVARGLIDSIRNSGDGKTTETAFVVISTDEEYALFSVLGLRVTAQALINEKGHNYDKMTTVDPKTNETVIYYFNIDKPFNWLGNSLKQ